MKKIYSFLISILLINFALAREVAQPVAAQVAKNFYQHNSGQQLQESSLTLAYECKGPAADPVYYIYNVSTTGFVIVAAEDLVYPILGYGNSGTYNPSDVPPPVRDWLASYENQIRFIRKNKTTTTADVSLMWSNYANNIFPNSSAARFQNVGPLCQTKWNQAPNENGMCPFDQQHNENCVTGCPATAMAQIMKYYDYPAQGTGFHSYNEQHYGTLSANFGSTTYNWAGMPDILTSPDNDVALLMFHCGVAVEMNYGVAATGGSGSYVCIDYSPSVEQTCENAFKTYFGYDPSISGKLRSNFTDPDWVNMVKGELDASRPIQYAGFGNGGGHTWVCDGYDQNNLYHMNWGWGGNSDGFFSLNDLDPTSLGAGGGTGGFNNNQQMLIGIKPLGGGGGGGGGTVNQDGISLYSAITVNANPIQILDPLTVYAQIQNTGTNNFTGDVAAALFNSEGVFLMFIQEFTNVTMNTGFYYDFQFDLASLDVIPGQCIIGVFYKNASDEYSLVAPNTFSNPVAITATSFYSDLQMYSNSTVAPTSPQVNQSFTVTTQLANIGGSDFNGWLSADLYTLEGDYVTNIQELSSQVLQAGFYYTKAFTTSGVSIEPGTYYIAFWASVDYTNWEFFYNANFPNPITVVITDQTVSPDQYEYNDLEGSAHVFPVNFVGNNADLNTGGSNMHVANDYDFYKIVLPPGNNYSVTASVDDSYHLNGGSYTNDVQWSFNVNSAGFSTTYDDVMGSDIVVINGGTVVFFVSDYFAGTTGSYQLNLHVVKGPIGVEEINRTELSVFPNPVSDKFYLTSPVLTGSYEFRIYNQLGAVVKSGNQIADRQTLQLNVKELEAGLYNIYLSNERGSYSTKFIVE